MQFSVKVSDYQKNIMINMCDAELMGKDVVDGELKININENYYGKQLVEKSEAISLLKSASIMNLVGNETISLATELGIGSESGVKIISNIPFLIIFNTWNWFLFYLKSNVFYLVWEIKTVDWYY